MRIQYENSIYELMKENPRIIALVSDSGTGMYKRIKEEMPDRYLDFGISENTMIVTASGLASDGWIPVVYAINNFLVYRSYEFIRNDICIDKRNVKIVGLGAGVIQNMQGPSHHTLEDIACLRVLPNLTLLSPGSPKEVRGALEAAVKIDGPVYIRLAKMYETEIFEGEVPKYTVGGLNVPFHGKDLTVFSTGSITGDVCTAAKELYEEGLHITVVNVNSLKPVDGKAIVEYARQTHKVLVVEEHSKYGGLGGIIAEILVAANEGFKFRQMAFNDLYVTDYGWHQDIKRKHGLSPENIANTCREMILEN